MSNNRSRAVKVMVEHHPECTGAKDEDGCTALHMAVLSNNFTTVTMLLKQVTIGIDWDKLYS